VFEGTTECEEKICTYKQNNSYVHIRFDVALYRDAYEGCVRIVISVIFTVDFARAKIQNRICTN
jgi:hypothetical protein